MKQGRQSAALATAVRQIAVCLRKLRRIAHLLQPEQSYAAWICGTRVKDLTQHIVWLTHSGETECGRAKGNVLEGLKKLQRWPGQELVQRHCALVDQNMVDLWHFTRKITLWGE